MGRREGGEKFFPGRSLIEIMDKMGNADKFNGSMAISSSSSSFLNSDGVEHFSSTTARMGPGGIAEFQRQVRDGRTGEETIVMERRLGDQARIVEKMRNVRTGDEVTTQSNVGIQEGMEDRFDEEWQRAAQAIGGPAPREPRLKIADAPPALARPVRCGASCAVQ